MWRNQKNSSKGYQPSVKNAATPFRDNNGDGQRVRSSQKASRSGSERREDSLKDIAVLTDKIQRMIPAVEKAVRADSVHEAGVSGCENCQLSRISYKRMIQQIKTIEGIADEVVEKELRALMDAEDEDSNGKGDDSGGNWSPVNECNHKYSIKKMMADTILQICFVKTKNLGGEERFKHFDTSIDVLSQLKFQLTVLTDDVIQLCLSRRQASGRDGGTCVDCVKENVTDCTKMLREMMQSGKSLKLVKTEERDPEGKCCVRPYPHIHTSVEGKPIVFKYSKV